MIVFKDDYIKALPYDKELYTQYFDDEAKIPSVRWYGVSLQLEKFDLLQAIQFGDIKDFDLVKSIAVLNEAFNVIVSKLDDGSIWIVSHEDKDMQWFVRDDDKLPVLRNLFRTHHVDGSFSGAIVGLKEDLLAIAEDLVSYPYVLSRKNLDVSHGRLPFIVKTTGHLTIDLLSTDVSLLDDVANNIALQHLNQVRYRVRDSDL